MAVLLLPGTATPANVLASKTFSAGANYNVAGTMPDRGAVTLTPSTSNVAIAAGYHNGSGYVQGDADLVSANIKYGKNIFGVAGKFEVVDTAGTTAGASGVLSGYTCYSNGYLITGTMPNMAGGSVQTATSTSAPGDGNLRFYAPAGYYNGNVMVGYYDADFIAANIVNGKSIFGITGTFNKIYGKGDTINGGNLHRIHSLLDTYGSGSFSKTASGICISKDGNGYVYACNGNPYQVTKTTSTLSQVWINSDSPYSNSVASDSAGNVIICYYATIASGGKVRKLNGSGTQVWVNTDIDRPIRCITDKSDNIYVIYDNSSGKQIRKLNSAGAEIWSVSDAVPADVNDIYLDSSETWVWVSFSSTPDVKRYTVNGALVQTVGANSNADCVAGDCLGNTYIGYINSVTVDLRVYNTAGNGVWTYSSTSGVSDIIVDDNGVDTVNFIYAISYSGEDYMRFYSGGTLLDSTSVSMYCNQMAFNKSLGVGYFGCQNAFYSYYYSEVYQIMY
jgi:hypothetical protein